MRRLFVGIVLVVLAAACDLANDDHPDPHPTITVVNHLDCEEIVSFHVDPDEEFEGFATPEEAVAGSVVGELGPAESGGGWVIYLEERPVARVIVGLWRQDRYVVFDHEVCADVWEMIERGEL